MSNKLDVVKNQIFYANQDPNSLAKTISDLITDVVTTVKVSGPTEIELDTTDGSTATYTGQAYSQFVDKMSSEVTLSLKTEVTGVSILAGVVTVVSTVVDGTTFVVKGVVGSVTNELTVTVNVTEAEAEA